MTSFVLKALTAYTRTTSRSAFRDSTSIVTSTLLGSISRHTLSTKGNAEDWTIESNTVVQTRFISKVNALAVHSDNVAVGGFRADGKGTAEVYQSRIM